MGGEEGRRRHSADIKSEKGKSEGPLVEALGCRLKDIRESVRIAEWKSASSQTNKQAQKQSNLVTTKRMLLVTTEWMTWREMKQLIPQVLFLKSFKNFTEKQGRKSVCSSSVIRSGVSYPRRNESR